MPEATTTMEKIVSLCKRRGFYFPERDLRRTHSCWDYGPLGVELKRNVKEAWWRMVQSRDDMVGLDTSILMHPQVWVASGHIKNFSDPLVECKTCKKRWRADELDKNSARVAAESFRTRQFNLMFKTFMGPSKTPPP